MAGNRLNWLTKNLSSKLTTSSHMRLANGGGYGDPLERDPQLVLKDVIDGIVSRQAARETYGVVLKQNEQTIDLTATENLRRTRHGDAHTPNDGQSQQHQSCSRSAS